MKSILAMVVTLGLMGATPALARHPTVGGTVQIRFGRSAPPPVIHYRAPASCPPVMTYRRVSRGHWAYRTVQVWRPGYWTTVWLPCGRSRHQWVPGRHELVSQRVWVH